MLLLAFGVAIFDLHTRLARLESHASPLLLAALGAAVGCCIVMMIIHPSITRENNTDSVYRDRVDARKSCLFFGTSSFETVGHWSICDELIINFFSPWMGRLPRGI